MPSLKQSQNFKLVTSNRYESLADSDSTSQSEPVASSTTGGHCVNRSKSRHKSTPQLEGRSTFVYNNVLMAQDNESKRWCKRNPLPQNYSDARHFHPKFKRGANYVATQIESVPWNRKQNGSNTDEPKGKVGPPIQLPALYLDYLKPVSLPNSHNMRARTKLPTQKVEPEVDKRKSEHPNVPSMRPPPLFKQADPEVNQGKRTGWRVEKHDAIKMDNDPCNAKKNINIHEVPAKHEFKPRSKIVEHKSGPSNNWRDSNSYIDSRPSLPPRFLKQLQEIKKSLMERNSIEDQTVEPLNLPIGHDSALLKNTTSDMTKNGDGGYHKCSPQALPTAAVPVCELLYSPFIDYRLRLFDMADFPEELYRIIRLTKLQQKVTTPLQIFEFDERIHQDVFEEAMIPYQKKYQPTVVQNQNQKENQFYDGIPQTQHYPLRSKNALPPSVLHFKSARSTDNNDAKKMPI